MTGADHIEQMLWACAAAERALPVFEQVFPDDPRPREAIAAGRQWAEGEITMTMARKAAFAAHAAARVAKAASNPSAERAARAAGHAAATAHVIDHAQHAARYAMAALSAPED